MRISLKIALSISLLVVIAILILVMSLVNMNRVNGIVRSVATVSAPRVAASGEILNVLNENDLALRNLLLFTRPEDRQKTADALSGLKNRMTGALSSLDSLMPEEGKKRVDALRKAWDDYMAVNAEISAKALQNTADQARKLSLGPSSAAFTACIESLDGIGDMLGKSSAFAARPTLARVNETRADIYALQGLEKDAVLEVDQARVNAIQEKANALMATLAPEVEFVVKGQKLPSGIRAKCAEFGELYEKARAACVATIAMTVRNEDQKAFVLAETTGKEKGSVVHGLVTSISKEAASDLQSQTVLSEATFRSSVFWQIVISVAGLVISLTLVGLVIRGIIRNLDRVIHNLSDSAGQVNTAANAISDSSTHLADGARAQAGHLQDTSATLEEMASMTRRNADTAKKTNLTTTSTVELVASGSQAVRQMSGAMGEINEQSEKISNIIKTIEEIAFQTNLLALNAAVEAARAGEAGKGFAVVADEVRNLAGRSAQAARDTSELIVGTVAKVKNGSEIANRLADSFKAIEEGTGEFKQHMQEITQATDEQAHGVDQVNTTMAQLDKSTQANAAYAEESSRASRELKSQADLLSGIVEELSSLVKGGGVAAAPQPRAESGGRQRPARADFGAASRPGPAKAPGRPQAPALPGPAPRVVKPNDIIPLDEDF